MLPSGSPSELDRRVGPQQKQAPTAARRSSAKKPSRSLAVCSEQTKSFPPRRYTSAPSRRVSAVVVVVATEFLVVGLVSTVQRLRTRWTRITVRKYYQPSRWESFPRLKRWWWAADHLILLDLIMLQIKTIETTRSSTGCRWRLSLLWPWPLTFRPQSLISMSPGPCDLILVRLANSYEDIVFARFFGSSPLTFLSRNLARTSMYPSTSVKNWVKFLHCFWDMVFITSQDFWDMQTHRLRYCGIHQQTDVSVGHWRIHAYAFNRIFFKYMYNVVIYNNWQ